MALLGRPVIVGADRSKFYQIVEVLQTVDRLQLMQRHTRPLHHDGYCNEAGEVGGFGVVSNGFITAEIKLDSSSNGEKCV